MVRVVTTVVVVGASDPAAAAAPARQTLSRIATADRDKLIMLPKVLYAEAVARPPECTIVSVPVPPPVCGPSDTADEGGELSPVLLLPPPPLLPLPPLELQPLLVELELQELALPKTVPIPMPSTASSASCPAAPTPTPTPTPRPMSSEDDEEEGPCAEPPQAWIQHCGRGAGVVSWVWWHGCVCVCVCVRVWLCVYVIVCV